MKKTILSLLVAVGLIGSASAANLTGDLTNGLVAYYTFNGNANDSVGGYNGTVYDATLTTDRFGGANSAYSFNGSSSYIDLGNRPSFNFGNNDFTLSGWVNVNPADNYGYIISKYKNPDPLSYGLGTTGSSIYAFFSGETTGGAIDGTQSLKDSSWHFLSVTFTRGDAIRAYLDGTLNQTANISSATGYQTNSQSLLFGKLSDGSGLGSQYYYGLLDDVSIYNRALSSAEVFQLYTIPEPSTYALFGLGAIGMLMVMRRKRTV
jgi:hypothetical protein